VPVLSIVGYTNAGKSTLLRALTNADVRIEDKMFATLDPVSRRLRFPREREVIVTDTVGFIRDLPEELVAAFRATLEELSDASLLLHVIDVASPGLERHMSAVHKTLEQLGLREAPELLVFNKADALPPGEAEAIARRLGGIAVSAVTRAGLSDLLTRAEQLMWGGEDLSTEQDPAPDLVAVGR
jgi:GTP-binding protein HflX